MQYVLASVVGGRRQPLHSCHKGNVPVLIPAVVCSRGRQHAGITCCLPPNMVAAFKSMAFLTSHPLVPMCLIFRRGGQYLLVHTIPAFQSLHMVFSLQFYHCSGLLRLHLYRLLLIKYMVYSRANYAV